MRLSRSRSSLSRSTGGSGCSSSSSSSSSWSSSDSSLLELGLVLGEGRGLGHGNETDDLLGGRGRGTILREGVEERAGGRFLLPEAETGNSGNVIPSAKFTLVFIIVQSQCFDSDCRTDADETSTGSQSPG